MRFFESPLRVFLTADLLILFAMLVFGVLGGLFWTPIAAIFAFVSPLMFLVLHLPFIPYKYSHRWRDLPTGLIKANKILRNIWKYGERYKFYGEPE